MRKPKNGRWAARIVLFLCLVSGVASALTGVAHKGPAVIEGPQAVLFGGLLALASLAGLWFLRKDHVDP
jgi:hypothetical protein